MTQSKSFDTLQLSEKTLQAVRDMGFSEPTSVQERTIPPMMAWRDVIARAPTGTGKTCAFGIPIIEHLEPGQQGIQALILSPTRELAIQISDDITQLASTRPEVKVVTLYGGQPLNRQVAQLREKPQIVVATPGRLLDHLQRRNLTLSNVHTAVLDEADRMLDMGFVHDVRRILDRMPNVWQIAMFSATLSRSVMDISWIYQRDVVELMVEARQEDKPPITQYAIEASGQARAQAIMTLMVKKAFKKVLVFCNTKQNVRSVTQLLQKAGCKADCLHGDLRQSQRELVIGQFRDGHLPVRVSTDGASRGLDSDEVDAAFNYYIPEEN